MIARFRPRLCHEQEPFQNNERIGQKENEEKRPSISLPAIEAPLTTTQEGRGQASTGPLSSCRGTDYLTRFKNQLWVCWEIRWRDIPGNTVH